MNSCSVTPHVTSETAMTLPTRPRYSFETSSTATNGVFAEGAGAPSPPSAGGKDDVPRDDREIVTSRPHGQMRVSVSPASAGFHGIDSNSRTPMAP